jgi:hypothetical protein
MRPEWRVWMMCRQAMKTLALRLSTNHRPIPPTEQGISELMVEFTKHSAPLLFNLNQVLQ